MIYETFMKLCEITICKYSIFYIHEYSQKLVNESCPNLADLAWFLPHYPFPSGNENFVIKCAFKAKNKMAFQILKKVLFKLEITFFSFLRYDNQVQFFAVRIRPGWSKKGWHSCNT